MKQIIFHRHFRKGLSIVTGTAIYKLGFLAKDIILTSKLGLGSELTLFLTAYLIPNFLCNAFALSTQIDSAHDINTDQNRISWQRLGHILKNSLLFLLLASPLLYVGIPYFFSTENADAIRRLSLVLIPLMVCSPVRAALGQALYQSNYFILNFSLALITSLSLITYSLMTPLPTAEGLILAVSVGALLELIFTVIICNHLNLIFKSDKGLLAENSPALNFILQVMIMLPPVIDQIFAHQSTAQFLAIFNYANKVPSIVMTLMLVYSSSVLLPSFINLDIKRAFQKNIGKIYALVALTIGFLLVAPHSSAVITQLLYMRGKFSAADAAEVAHIQTMYFYALPAIAFHLGFVRYFNALKRPLPAIYISGASLVLGTLLSFWFVRIEKPHFIPLSIMVGYSLSYMVYFISQRLRTAP